ncbi:tetratricopeptide repeat protein [Ramlibacter sp. USB13]|uniref:protein O-GlcNAc transferase n=1 Tax=Ramlibacter cellulosilyticus TaxID=2764187 RepID=A0A923S9G7_9BURK|nr:tetratricopeptide repeat protein [Ramlibacter cellulosilyticus]
MTDAAGRDAPDLPRLFSEGRYRELEEAARALIARQPRHGGLWKALGVALAAQGRASEALEAKRQAVVLLPQDAEAQANLGNALAAAGDLQGALHCFREAARLRPDAPEAWQVLARALMRAHAFPEAEHALQRLVELQPDSADAHNELGTALRELHRMPEAARCYRRALELQPGLAQAENNLANTLADLGQAAEAEAAYRRALAIDPQRGEVHSNLGNLLKDQGRLAEARECYRAAMALAPGFAGAHSNLLLALNHDATLPLEEALAQARRFGAAVQSRAGGPLAGAPRPHPGPLRVGFVSGDLRSHPVGYFLEGWLPHVDRRRIALVAYPTVTREDALTARLRPHFAAWRSIAGLSDEAAARAIHADGIDLLVDLAGHTAHNALPVFAWKPAPVQASWLGYFATTGVPAIDWLLADEASVPPEHQAHFTERVWTLPGSRLCFAPPEDAPAVAPTPALRQGAVTFGCFQMLGKIGDDVLQLWSAVLARVPEATLRLQNKALGDARTRDAFVQRLRRHAIDPERVHLHGQLPRPAYLAAHADVDLLLDTFPYPGGTTTCEALWMGVPTLTLRGDRMLARQGAALLAAAGLPEWVAQDPHEYVEKAVRFAGDPQALQALRAGLRAQVRRSPLFDGRLFAERLTEAFEGLAQASAAAG